MVRNSSVLVSGDFKNISLTPPDFFVSNFVEVITRSSSKKKKGDFFCHLRGGTMKSPCFLGYFGAFAHFFLKSKPLTALTRS